MLVLKIDGLIKNLEQVETDDENHKQLVEEVYLVHLRVRFLFDSIPHCLANPITTITH